MSQEKHDICHFEWYGMCYIIITTGGEKWDIFRIWEYYCYMV